MAFAKLFNLLAVSSLAVLVCTLNVSPVTALTDNHGMMRVAKRHNGHDGVAKRKRTTGKRCKTRSSSASSTKAATSSKKATSTSTSKAVSTSKSSSGGSNQSNTNSGGSSGGSQFTSPGSGKVGLAWPNGNDPSLSNFITSHTKFLYTWSESCPSNTHGLTCMPMLWNNAGNKVSAFKSKVKAGYAKIAMGFNEVNEPGQANMSPSDGVGAWLADIEPLKNEGYTLISPVTSSNPNGKTWYAEFLKECNGRCTIDAVAVHFYGTQPQDMIQYIKDWHSLSGNKPVYVTEFACQNFNTAHENNGQQCSESQVQNFYKTVIEFMETTSYVVAYFPFGFMKDMQGVNGLDQLMTSGGQPTDLGKKVINVSW